MKLKLVVGTDSTWSLRAWLCLKLASLAFDEVVIPLGKTGYKDDLKEYSDTMLVPVLIDGRLKVHDSLAIAEYVNELSDTPILPKSRQERAIARSLCAELHAGFMNLRTLCPFTLDAVEPVQMTDELSREVKRLNEIWSSANDSFIFESASIVDAFFSVMASRISSYSIHLDGKAGEYQRSLISWTLFQDALNQARIWKKIGD